MSEGNAGRGSAAAWTLLTTAHGVLEFIRKRMLEVSVGSLLGAAAVGSMYLYTDRHKLMGELDSEAKEIAQLQRSNERQTKDYEVRISALNEQISEL